LANPTGFNTNKGWSSQEKVEGWKKCYFCDSNETIKHLFFLLLPCKNYLEDCLCCHEVNPTRSINHMLRNWLTCIGNKIRHLIFVGIDALMWAIWCTRNDIIFEGKKFTSFRHADFKGGRHKGICLDGKQVIISCRFGYRIY
jgi:hypothetical protein